MVSDTGDVEAAGADVEDAVVLEDADTVSSDHLVYGPDDEKVVGADVVVGDDVAVAVGNDGAVGIDYRVVEAYVVVDVCNFVVGSKLVVVANLDCVGAKLVVVGADDIDCDGCSLYPSH